MLGLSRIVNKPNRKLLTPLTILSSLLFLIIGSIAVAMPPHRDLVDRITKGKIQIPYFLQHRSDLHTAGVNAGGEPILARSGFVSKVGVSGNFNILTLLVDFSDNTASVSATGS